MALRARQSEIERQYTVAEFEKLPQFGDRYELIDGKLVTRPMPGGRHSLIARQLIKAYDRFDPDGKVGLILQETSITLGPRNAPTPDVSFWKAERDVQVDDKAMPLPDLAVEIHSPSDLAGPVTLASAMIKVQKLLEAGVTLIWVVYPNRKTVEVYQADQDFKAGPVQILAIDDTLDAAPVIPGFKLALADLFNRA